MNGKLAVLVSVLFVLFAAPIAHAWSPLAVSQDPLLRMPGSQPAPENSIVIEAPNRCTNCHGGYDRAVEPEFNWKGSMMAQAGRDFLFWSCLTVAAQDSIWATGRPNATDLCLRCHMPKGWLEGRSDPTNGSRMTGSDFDGVQCDFCHNAFDPFFKATAAGTREGSDWTGYWDEGTSLSASSAQTTYNADVTASTVIRLFNGQPFYMNQAPFTSTYTESTSGQYFLTGSRDKRASFADASARHPMLYSRYHKSKYFCATCHDVSNPVLANLGADPAQPLPSEKNPGHAYFHVERTFSEFMLSDYGRQGGSAGIGPFAPAVFRTSQPGNAIATCQDCHMRDTTGKASSMSNAILRPTGSLEHPRSGQPLHDFTGGNVWVPWVLASAIPGSPNYNAVNDQLLRQGPAVLTLDLTQGILPDPAALLAGVDRARQQLQLAASIQNVIYDPVSGSLSFRVQNQTGHKLISGFPEGRRMFVNVKAYKGASLLHEVNPYDSAAGTLKGLSTRYSPSSPPLAAGENYVDDLVYEMHPTSSLTGEEKTFHFALATGRYKDNRIPPKGFRIAEAASRLSQPVKGGEDSPGMYSAAEYAGGYDEQAVQLPAGADRVEVALYYQTTSREYIEFLRDQINGTATTLTSPTPSGEAKAYIIQSDPFFKQLKAWGNTVWSLWNNNKEVPGAAPVLMASAAWGTPLTPSCTLPGSPVLKSAVAGKKTVTLAWDGGTPAPASGYRVYYNQGGKLQYRASVPDGTLSYKDTGLTSRMQYCYQVTAWSDCSGNGIFDPAVDMESSPSNTLCATAN